MADKGNMHTTYGSIHPPPVAFTGPTIFNPSEFSTLCDNISSNIYVIQSNASNLDRTQKQIGTPSDNAALRDKLHEIQQRTNQLVALTTQYLHQTSVLSRSGEKHHRLQAERLRNEFQTVVKRYVDIQKNVAHKIKTLFLNPQPSRMELTSPATDWSTDTDQTQLLDNMAAQQQTQKQVERELEEEQAFALERDERIRKIEGDILDINDIFRSLASMVSEQGQDITRIDENIERVTDEVEGGEQQLIAAASHQRKYRRNLFCLLAILLTVGIVIAIIVVLSVKT